MTFRPGHGRDAGPLRFYLVVVDKCPADRLNVIHGIIDEAATAWWHRLDAAWIVLTESRAADIRDLISPVIRDISEASVLVLRLPGNSAQRGWAFYGPSSANRTAWLRGAYREN